MAEPPREAAAIVGVLRAQGAPAWEPRVVAQLLEFSYRHVADVLDGAQQYAAHRSRDAHITQADVRLAAQSALTHTFTEPLAGEELARIVAPLNAAPLPPLASRPGVVVPAEGALLATNFQVLPKKPEATVGAAVPAPLGQPAALTAAPPDKAPKFDLPAASKRKRHIDGLADGGPDEMQMARKRGVQSHGQGIERHQQVFDRKSNAFRSGTACLPPPPAADSESKLPRKLRNAMALKAGLARQRLQPRGDGDEGAPARGDGGSQIAQKKPRPQPLAVGVAAGAGVVKRKPAFLSAKARRKKARREKERAAAEDAEHEPADATAPRFAEQAEAPPAMALNRKHSLGALFTKQLQQATAASASRDAYIAAYRKLRGHEALPYQ